MKEFKNIQLKDIDLKFEGETASSAAMPRCSGQ